MEKDFQHNQEVLSDKREIDATSLPFPKFPQPPKERPPFFPVFEERNRSLDHPDILHTLRRDEAEQSVLLHSSFECHRSKRHSTLYKILKTNSTKNIVLVMMVNLGFMDIFLNWVRSCDHNGIDPRSWALIFAMDSESAKQAEELGFKVYSDQLSYGEQPKEAPKAFGDRNFVRLMFAKTAIVQDVLQLGYHVLFQDADMIWKKDPSDYLFHSSRQGFDAQFMYDGPNLLYEPLHANSGFFFIRNTNESRTFWNMVFGNYDKMLHYRSQQKVINIVLLSRKLRGLKLNILPERDFANGHLFCEDKPSTLPANPYVIHCSWTRNVQHKIEKFKKANLWYL